MADFKSQTPAFQKLIRMMQAHPYGFIRHVSVKGGQPAITGETVIENTHKCGGNGKNGPCQQAGQQNFVLKQEHLDMIDALSNLGDGVVDIEVGDGLPRKVTSMIKAA